MVSKHIKNILSTVASKEMQMKTGEIYHTSIGELKVAIKQIPA